ncbi:MAG: hypothetical protein AAB225_16900, partial [Acidobacteriota bacterium]
SEPSGLDRVRQAAKKDKGTRFAFLHPAAALGLRRQRRRQRRVPLHYRELAQTCEHITLVFDKGNNSEAAFDTLAATPFHFVGSLVPSQHADLLAVPRRH